MPTAIWQDLYNGVLTSILQKRKLKLREVMKTSKGTPVVMGNPEGKP